jgi:3-hydroxyisobutyrate dehydrogenase-like beta-hydroxyacid dehydrogenase
LTTTARVGFVGFGQLASNLAPRLRRSPAVEVHGALVRSPASAATAARLAAGGVRGLVDPADLASCDLVLSAVTPDQAPAAAHSVLGSAGPRLGYVDLNSTSPAVQQQLAEAFAARGVRYTDGVLTGGNTRLDGDQIPIHLSGPEAEAVADRLRRWGFRATAISDRVGAASALKMARSIVVKGLEALAFEARLVARHYGCHDDLLASLEESIDRFPIRTFLDMLLATQVESSGRWAEEARMMCATVEAAGVEPLMSSATATLFARTARLAQPRTGGTGGSPEDLESYLERARQCVTLATSAGSGSGSGAET